MVHHAQFTPQEQLMGKWLELLRSGNYKQGTGRLKRINSDGTPQYCCLGVIAEGVLGRQFVPHGDGLLNSVVYFSPEDDESGEDEYSLNYYVTNLASSDAAAMGLDGNLSEDDVEILSKYGFVAGNEDTKVGALMWLNDSQEIPFYEIANIVEELQW